MLQSEELRHIAKLARLTLSEDELSTYTQQVDEVLKFFGQLHTVETAGTHTPSSDAETGFVLREDIPQASLSVRDALREASAVEGDYFRVPKILDT